MFIDYMSQTIDISSKNVKGVPGPGNYNPKPEKLKRQPSSWRYIK